MGFGFLLLGYFMAFLMSNLHAGFGFAGGYLMILGVWKLKDYKSKFRYSVYPIGAFMLLALFKIIPDLLWIMGESTAFFELATVKMIVMSLELLTVALVNITVFLSISELANDVGLEKLRVSALRNIYFFLAYGVLCAVRYLPIPYSADVLKYFNLAIQLMQLFWIIVSLITLISCFRSIADKDKLDEEIAREIEQEKKRDEGGK